VTMGEMGGSKSASVAVQGVGKLRALKVRVSPC